MVQNNYNIFQKEQEKFLENIHVKWDNAAKKLVSKIEKATDECNTSVDRTNNASENLFKVEQLRDLMYYAAPLLVLFDVVLRIAPWVVGLFG